MELFDANDQMDNENIDYNPLEDNSMVDNQEVAVEEMSISQSEEMQSNEYVPQNFDENGSTTFDYETPPENNTFEINQNVESSNIDEFTNEKKDIVNGQAQTQEEHQNVFGETDFQTRKRFGSPSGHSDMSDSAFKKSVPFFSEKSTTESVPNGARSSAQIDPTQMREFKTSIEGIKANVRQEADNIRREFGLSSTAQRDQMSRVESTIIQGIAGIKSQSGTEHIKTRSEAKIASDTINNAVEKNNSLISQVNKDINNNVEINARGIMEKIDEANKRLELNTADICSEIKEQSENIINRVSDITYLNAGTSSQSGQEPLQSNFAINVSYLNIKYSVTSLVFALMSVIVSIMSCIEVFKQILINGLLDPLILIDFGFVYVLAIVGIVTGLIQKKKFFKKGLSTLKEYFSTNQQKHIVAKTGIVISFFVIAIATIFLIVVLASFLIAMFLK